jgi:prepilin-type N-terminal cleavage/methylation domain-containing protein
MFLLFKTKKTMKQKRIKIKGFTLIELLIVIAIIGILASIVLVSTRSGIDQSKRASALTTASSVLPEIVACSDDGGNITGYNGNNGSGSANICDAAGHSVPWPSTNTTGWNINAGSTSGGNIPSNYTFNITPPSSGTAYSTISCNIATSTCQ